LTSCRVCCAGELPSVFERLGGDDINAISMGETRLFLQVTVKVSQVKRNACAETEMISEYWRAFIPAL
jgi:hypothetical protein